MEGRTRQNASKERKGMEERERERERERKMINRCFSMDSKPNQPINQSINK